MATKLSAQQALKIADAEARYADAKAALEDAKAEREAVRERYAPRVPIGQLIRAGGLTIKRRVQAGGPTFRIAKYLERNKLTAAMRPFFSTGSSHEVWEVKPAAGFSPPRARRSRPKPKPREPVEA